MLRSRFTICLILASVAVFTGNAGGTVMVYGTHTEDAVMDGAELEDVRMEVEMSVSNGVAAMVFTNVSVLPEDSVVFKAIVVDLKDDDTGGEVLWDPVVRNDLSDAVYSWGPYDVLPGFNPVITDSESMIELLAESPPPHNGIAPGGERLIVEFSTSLADGSDIEDYLAFFDGGDDTAAYSIGFQAISAFIIDDDADRGSLSGSYIPEPSALALISLGALAFAWRRRRRSRAQTA